MYLVRDYVALHERNVRLMMRQPVWLAVMLVQPLVWLLLYSQLFGHMTVLGGFGTSSYLQFIAPGIAILGAFSHGVWDGGGVVQDIDRGAFDRFLATPLPPAALMVSRAMQAAMVGTLQALIIVVSAMAFGAELEGGALGLAAILLAASLVCVAFAAMSHGLALVFRRQETMIAVGQFAVLPLMFTSAMLTTSSQMPPWMRQLASANPVNWAVSVARSGMLGTDWGSSVIQLGGLVALVVIAEAFALLALARYVRSL